MCGCKVKAICCRVCTGSDEEDSDQEARAWEEQQIRKGVSIPAQQVGF